jgi:hypothetical protein
MRSVLDMRVGDIFEGTYGRHHTGLIGLSTTGICP